MRRSAFGRRQENRHGELLLQHGSLQRRLLQSDFQDVTRLLLGRFPLCFVPLEAFMADAPNCISNTPT